MVALLLQKFDKKGLRQNKYPCHHPLLIYHFKFITQNLVLSITVWVIIFPLQKIGNYILVLQHAKENSNGKYS